MLPSTLEAALTIGRVGGREESERESEGNRERGQTDQARNMMNK